MKNKHSKLSKKARYLMLEKVREYTDKEAENIEKEKKYHSNNWHEKYIK